jgi:hypothetical protein
VLTIFFDRKWLNLLLILCLVYSIFMKNIYFKKCKKNVTSTITFIFHSPTKALLLKLKLKLSIKPEEKTKFDCWLIKFDNGFLKLIIQS